MIAPEKSLFYSGALDVKDMLLSSAPQRLLGEVGLAYTVEDEFILVTASKEDAAA